MIVMERSMSIVPTKRVFCVISVLSFRKERMHLLCTRGGSLFPMYFSISRFPEGDQDWMAYFSKFCGYKLTDR